MEYGETSERHEDGQEGAGASPGEDRASGELASWAESLNEGIRHQAGVRPYTTVLAAAAAGYVLGAGIPRWAWRTAFDVGSKLLIARLLATIVDDD